MNDASTFADWLFQELDQRGWSQAQLADTARVSRTAINDVLNGKRRAGPDLCNAIAAAFGYSPEFVFRQAGILPHDDESVEPPGILELMEIFKNASAAEREEMLEYVRWRAQRAREEKDRARKRKLRPGEA